MFTCLFVFFFSLFFCGEKNFHSFVCTKRKSLFVYGFGIVCERYIYISSGSYLFLQLTHIMSEMQVDRRYEIQNHGKMTKKHKLKHKNKSEKQKQHTNELLFVYGVKTENDRNTH